MSDAKTVVRISMTFTVIVDGDHLPAVEPLDLIEHGVAPFASSILPGAKVSVKRAKAKAVRHG